VDELIDDENGRLSKRAGRAGNVGNRMRCAPYRILIPIDRSISASNCCVPRDIRIDRARIRSPHWHAFPVAIRYVKGFPRSHISTGRLRVSVVPSGVAQLQCDGGGPSALGSTDKGRRVRPCADRGPWPDPTAPWCRSSSARNQSRSRPCSVPRPKEIAAAGGFPFHRRVYSRKAREIPRGPRRFAKIEQSAGFGTPSSTACRTSSGLVIIACSLPGIAVAAYALRSSRRNRTPLRLAFAQNARRRRNRRRY